MIVQTHPPGAPGEFYDVADLWTHDKEEFGSRGRIDTTLGVGMAAAAWAPLRRLLEADVPDRLEISDEEVVDLLDGAAERLEDSGIAVEWDPGLNQTPRAARWWSAGPADSARAFRMCSTTNALQGFSWQLSLDGKPLADEETGPSSRTLTARSSGCATAGFWSRRCRPSGPASRTSSH